MFARFNVNAFMKLGKLLETVIREKNIHMIHLIIPIESYDDRHFSSLHKKQQLVEGLSR